MDLVKKIDLRGMYINITLTDDWMLRSAEQVVIMADHFGLNDTLDRKRIIVDYSSPNVAKILHAGHIRSTITGEVLSNIYDACGATVFRINHINDFGGFGFLLEGHRRFYSLMNERLSENERLLEIYKIRRSLERVVTDSNDIDKWAPEDFEILNRYFPGARDAATIRKAFESFTQSSDKRFKDLENGDPQEISLWQKMVRCSLADFDEFYRQLNIDIDFTIGESFYFQDGLDAINEALLTETAYVFTEEHARRELDAIEVSRTACEISDGEVEFRRNAILKDVGSTVVDLQSGERFVLLRSDGRSIYATRDVGAIARRNELFSPDRVIYVVGQEQQSHFERLFATAKVLGMVENKLPELQHLYFGFYVDQATGKKLSSRASVSNVMALLEKAESYFYNRMSEREGIDRSERAKTARELTVGSLVFNDLKQDIKGSVEIDATNLENTIQSFERSGGAYTVYTACRARSILRRHGKSPKLVSEIEEFELSDQEVKLLLMLQLVPETVAEAAKRASPTLLLRQLLDIAMEYNSYYNAVPVLTKTGANESRLLITKAVQLVLTNGLKICHIDTPDSI